MTIFTLIMFVVGLAMVTAGADLFVRGASRLAIAIGVSPLVIGLTVVAYGTSAPELAVCLQASAAGSSDIAVGNVVGSNICNILLILGLSSVVAPLVVSRQLTRTDVPLMIGISVLLLVMSLDGRIGRLEGLLLFTGSVTYTVVVIRASRRATKKAEAANGGHVAEKIGFAARWFWPVVFVVAGVAVLVLGADWVKDGAIEIARFFAISELIIALTIVAIGTSLPEIATSVMAAVHGERDIAVGNAVGSNIFNILLVIGLTALVSPSGIAVSSGALRFDMPVMIAVAIGSLPIFTTGHMIRRSEGLFFLLYFAAYTAFLIFNAGNHETLTMRDTAFMVFIVPLVVITFVIIVKRVWQQRRSG